MSKLLAISSICFACCCIGLCIPAQMAASPQKMDTDMDTDMDVDMDMDMDMLTCACACAW